MNDFSPQSDTCRTVNEDSSTDPTQSPQVRVSIHRPPALTLPADPADASAQALAFIRGDDVYIRAQAVEAMHKRASALVDADSDAALTELAHHLPILEALWLKFAAEASVATKVEHKATLLRMALAAQSAFSRTQALIAGLRQQRGGRGRVVVDDSDSGE